MNHQARHIFIYEFAMSEGSADVWLENRGWIYEAYSAEPMRELCKAWLLDPNLVKKICPTFYSAITNIAIECESHDENDFDDELWLDVLKNEIEKKNIGSKLLQKQG